MLIRQPNDVLPSEITPERVYMNRRAILLSLGAMATAPLSGALAAPAASAETSNYRRNAELSTTESPNSFEDITTYNNFYEFGTSKEAPAENARNFRTKPWTVTVAGEAEITGKFYLEDILKPHPPEERVYRLRCVEAWSMVIPWLGFPLGELLRRFKPTSRAKYVEFTTLFDPKQMLGQRYAVLDWPYVEGLRTEEAMHPLAFMATGLYGRALPNQNGAPLRLVVPWKYGFKSIKSIVRIRFTETRPSTTWNRLAPTEYGFFSNVNPEVDHPRWSQKRERWIGAGLFSSKRPTQLFNGYADQISDLYRGLDLRANF
jgi:sulfoxide reductase catalytic subunit YedY